MPNLKDALGSAVDVMQAMASSIYSLSSKVSFYKVHGSFNFEASMKCLKFIVWTSAQKLGI